MSHALLDTCALLWWTLDPDKLSVAGLEALSRAETEGAVISSISIWEIGIKIKKGKLALGISLAEYVRRLRRLDRFEIVPVDDAIWLENLALTWSHADPADRTIVATARLRGLPIITKDEVMSAFYPRTIW